MKTEILFLGDGALVHGKSRPLDHCLYAFLDFIGCFGYDFWFPQNYLKAAKNKSAVPF